MHPAAFEYVRDVVEKLPIRKSVLEYGGKDVNGTVRHLFPDASYVSIDLLDGAGVDIVADAATFRPVNAPDTVVCCEVLEHSAKWADIIAQAARVLEVDGVFIMTCATTGRAPHGVDGMQVQPGEYYGNVEVNEMMSTLGVYFSEYDLDVNTPAGDLYVTAFKSERLKRSR